MLAESTKRMKNAYNLKISSGSVEKFVTEVKILA